jgi:hypothetical protein
VTPTATLRRKHAKSCTRTASAGTLTRALVPAGADSIAFSGRLGSRSLRPGRYQASLSASNAAGHSRAVSLAFVVVR